MRTAAQIMKEGMPVLQLDEVRVVDPTSGGEKGQKEARFSLIPREFLWELACHYGRGARKYADRNWEKGYKWSLSQDAAERHFNQWLLGEDNDQETGTNHLVCTIWHLVALFTFSRRNLGNDDIRRGPISIGTPFTDREAGEADGLRRQTGDDRLAAN